MTYELIPAGAITRVNDEQVGEQFHSSITPLADGGALVVFEDRFTDTSDWTFDQKVIAQRFDAAGNAVGVPVTIIHQEDVNLVSGSYQYFPVAIGLSDGGYAIGWNDLATNQIRVQTFSAAGSLLTDTILDVPDYYIASRDEYAEVSATGAATMAALDNGGFAVTWDVAFPGAYAAYAGGSSVYTQTFSSTGTATSLPKTIMPWVSTGDYTQDLQSYIGDSTQLSDGRYLVLMRGGIDAPGNDSDRPAVVGQIFSNTGAALTGTFKINEDATTWADRATVAVLENGDFVVAWLTGGLSAWRRFDSDGNPVTAEMKLDLHYADLGIVATQDGGFLISAAYAAAGSVAYDTYGYRFDADNVQVGPRFELASRQFPDVDTNYYGFAPEFVTLGNGQMMSLIEGHASWNGNAWEVFTWTFLPEKLGSLGNDTLISDADGMALFGRDGNDSLQGDVAADHLDGGAGNDTITGGAGNDTLIADAGTDRLDGGTGDDRLVTGPGDNTLIGGVGTDRAVFGVRAGSITVSGPADALVIEYAGSRTVVQGIEVFEFTDGYYSDVLDLDDLLPMRNKVIYGTDAAETLVGDYGDDYIYGYAGNDLLIGGEGNDSLYGADGDDTVRGEAGNDSLFGYSGNDLIEGGTGNDTLRGETGDDTLIGGTGDNLLDGGAGNDSIQGDVGADTLLGSYGNDTLIGAAGDDSIDAYVGDDVVDAGAGNDTIVASWGNNTVHGGDGTDLVRIEFASTQVTSVTGPDTALAMQSYWGTSVFTGVESFEFSDGVTRTLAEMLALRNLTLTGTEGADTLTGGYGDDTLTGLGGNDLLDGGAGNDVIDGGSGDDTVIGGAGTDRAVMGLSTADVAGVSGSTAELTIISTQGVDRFDGVETFQFTDAVLTAAEVLALIEVPPTATEGNDSLVGTAGDDLIDGLGGNDTLRGEGGNDTLIGGLGDDQLFGAAGADVLTGGLGADLLDGGLGNDRLIGLGGNDTLRAGAGNDTLLGGAGADRLSGVMGANRIETGLGNDTVIGGTGNDTIIGQGTGTNRLSGNGGDDVIRAARGGDYLAGGAGNDKLTGNVGLDTMLGGLGNDTLLGGAGNDRLYGAGGADVLGGGGGNDRLDGGLGNDMLNGGLGNDTLLGGGGRDVLAGGAGADRLVGGAMADVFVFARGGGRDTVVDFQNGLDRIRIDSGASDFSDLALTDLGADTRIAFANVVIVLKGVDTGLIDDGDFLFG